MAEYICVGDSICLFCEDSRGFVYCDQTSPKNGLYVYKNQERERPSGIPNATVVTFTICTPSRYKLTKKYRQLCEQNERGLVSDPAQVTAAKIAADAETDDNVSEQKRMKNKTLRYGEIIQLKHDFTGKFIMASTTETSSIDKNKMMIFLDKYSSKSAQFRIVPRYKVKAESELVEVNDRIVLESVKSPGQYLHSSRPYQIDFYHYGSEVNLGKEQTSYSVLRYTCNEEDCFNIKGGSVIRLFHKDLEAYLVAEGVYGEEPMENVHLRVRLSDPLISRTLYPPRSGITYWQVEAEKSIIAGDIITWGSPFRLRHMTTRQYLHIDKDLNVGLTEDGHDPYTVLRFHNMSKGKYDCNMKDEANVRIEHVLTRSWLHYPVGGFYIKNEYCDHGNRSSISAVLWDDAELKQLSANVEQKYEDAFIIKKVQPLHLNDFNFVAGYIPFLRNLITERKNGITMTARRSNEISEAMNTLKEFMIVQGKPKKDCQKLLRNLRVVDILVDLVRCPFSNLVDEHHVSKVFMCTYQVLMTYLSGESSKNSLYFAKYIDQYDSEAFSQGNIGIQMAGVMIEVIKDNRKIVDRFEKRDINKFINLVITNRHSMFIKLLGVLCVCRGIAMTDNQTQIAEELLEKHKSQMFHIEVGQDIKQTKDVLYVSKDSRRSWQPLHKFVDPSAPDYVEEDHLFLDNQLELFKLLCYGRNCRAIEIVTKNIEFFTWEVAFCGLNSKFLSETMKAKICDLIIGLFVDVSGNFTIHEMASNNYVFGEIDVEEPDEKEAIQMNAAKLGSKDLDVGFPCLRLWLIAFFKENQHMTASNKSRNILLKEVLRLVHHLVMFGYISSSIQIEEVKKPLLLLLDGSKDMPYLTTVGSSMKNFKKTLDDIAEYRKSGRYTIKPGTEMLVEAKLQALELLEILMCTEFNRRVKHFVALFKEGTLKANEVKRKMRSAIDPLMKGTFDPDEDLWNNKKEQALIFGRIELLFRTTALFDDGFPNLLLDLTCYQSEPLLTKALHILNKYYTSKKKLFQVGLRAQVLLSLESTRVHREVLQSMHTLRALAKSCLNHASVDTMSTILSNYSGLCHVPRQPDMPHYIGQNILVNNGVLEIIMEIVTQEVDHHIRQNSNPLKEQYSILQKAFSSALSLLRFMAQDNQIVKEFIFEHLDQLLSVQTCGSDTALAIKEAFIGMQIYCLRIQPYQIAKIIRLAAHYQYEAPEFFDLARTLIKMKDTGMILRRNQVIITKTIMENYAGAAYVMAMNAEERLAILSRRSETHHLQYLVSLISLLGTCAEGQNRYIESLCQTLLPLDEILDILNNEDVENILKQPVLHYLMWAYMRTARTPEESGMDDMPHSPAMWKFIRSTIPLANMTMDTVNKMLETRQRGSQFIMLSDNVDEFMNRESVYSTENNINYLIEGVMPFLQTFFGKFFESNMDCFPEEIEVVNQLCSTFLAFCDRVRPHIRTAAHMIKVMDCMDCLLGLTVSGKMEMHALMDRYQSFEKLRQLQSSQNQEKNTHNAEEVQLNTDLHRFAKHCLKIYEGQNITAFQLQVKSSFRKNKLKKRYVDADSDSPLPLGLEFQHHVKTFLRPDARDLHTRYCNASRLIFQLGFSAARFKRVTNKDQDAMDIRSLQILRAVIYNRIVLLPDDWMNNLKKHKRLLTEIEDLQNFMNDVGIVHKILPLLSRQSNDLVREVLALLDTLFFNANKHIQKNILNYFNNTREEDFFFAVRQRLELTKSAIKEKRALEAQKKMRKLELAKTATSSMSNEQMNEVASSEANVAPSVISTVISRKSSSNPFTNIQRHSTKMSMIEEEEELETRTQRTKTDLGFENPAFSAGDEEANLDDMSLDDYKDEGSIQLVIQVLAGMCDGQFRPLQNYIRDQPDNLKTVNVVQEITQFVSTIYSHIDGSSIALATQLFETINEFCQGVQENRAVILNNKSVDYINFMLRATKFERCSPEQVIQLWEAIGSLISSMIEESSPEAYAVAKDVQQTLDMEAVYRVMTACYQMHQNKKSDIYKLTHCEPPDILDSSNQDMKEMKDDLWNCGFRYYAILARMYDIAPNMDKELKISPDQKKASKYYKSRSMSVELIKDDYLQRRYFKVKNPSLLREDLKEKVKWNIDRSSSRIKLRELVLWSKDMVNDIYYQKTMLKNPLISQLAKKWTVWNYLCIIQSMVIQIMMLICYVAPGMKGFKDLPEDAPLPNEIYDVNPEISWPHFEMALFIIGLTHNFCSLMLLICYLLLYHPRMPRDSDLPLIKKLTSYCFGKAEEYPDEDKKGEKEETKLDATLLSFETLYYLVLFACSIGGTFSHGYLYAVHLLNIVATNQLLQGVIKAVTLNGKSLLWVGILGLIILYLYALIGFAFFRPVFNPANEYFCGTLVECYITTIRYGLLGDLNDMRRDPREENFTNFGFLTMYQVSFFIIFTTIGLNVIFGIIVDTFSELRDVKWAAEKDMQNTCFICGKDAYEFEHTGLGFQHHVQNEHNMWAYVFYFNHLHETKHNDYSALDMYVYNMMKEDKLDFFPSDRAICLDRVPEDSTESKVDDIMDTVNKILQKQEEQDFRRAQNKELERQRQWQEEQVKKLMAPEIVMATKSTQTDDITGGQGSDDGRPAEPVAEVAEISVDLQSPIEEMQERDAERESMA